MDVNNAQDATLNNVDPEPTKEGGNTFWKNMLRTVLSITISIILTFGTSALIQWRRHVKDRKMTALMVIGNIESFAQQLDKSADYMRWNDTLATYLLIIPQDSLDLVDIQILLFGINNVAAFQDLSHDKSAENIFSNSIDTWKNLNNFKFIENVGNCFASMHSMEEIYNGFLNTPEQIRKRLLQNPEAYPGNTILSKALRDKEYRDFLSHIHSQAEYYHYLAAYLRWENSKNMKLMGITEQEVKNFIEESNKQEGVRQSAPNQNAFRTPLIDLDSLPDFKAWVNRFM